MLPLACMLGPVDTSAGIIAVINRDKGEIFRIITNVLNRYAWVYKCNVLHI